MWPQASHSRHALPSAAFNPRSKTPNPRHGKATAETSRGTTRLQNNSHNLIPTLVKSGTDHASTSFSRMIRRSTPQARILGRTICSTTGKINEKATNITIKEYISNGDYDISITVGIVAVRDGVIVDEYPEEGIREVREFLDENKAIEVSSVFFELFDISRIVVTRFALNQDTHSNRQTIDVKALSDEDYVIKNTDY